MNDGLGRTEKDVAAVSQSTNLHLHRCNNQTFQPKSDCGYLPFIQNELLYKSFLQNNKHNKGKWIRFS
jgi:hypothetical protein